MTLYLKYRPKNLDELDLKDVAESLKKILSKKEIPHAFLFAGPKGTGKTSAARILAKVIDCENLKDGKPCDKCTECTSITNGSNLDVVEMDAASHRGIEDIRLLRDAVKLAPTSAKKKIYIIDEAHMLTPEASNALLKTLEEPPDHVIFILATTNPEKLIETIRSRTTYIPFRKATNEEIATSLKRVVKGEKIEIDDGTLGVIASAAGGSFRDGIKILEQLVLEEKKLTKDFIEEYLFKKKDFDIKNTIELFVKKDIKNLVGEVGRLSSKGVAVDTFTASILTKLRAGLLNKVGVGNEQIDLSKDELIELISLLEDSLNIADSPIEELPLEIAIIKWGSGAEDGDEGKLNTEDGIRNMGENNEEKKAEQKIEAEVKVEAKNETITQVAGVNEDIWKNILSLVKPVNATIEALLRASKPMTYDGKILTLGVYYKFHKERLEDVHHRKILEDAVAKVLHAPTRVTCVLVEPPPKKIIETKIEPVLTEGKDGDIIKAAEEIFGN